MPIGMIHGPKLAPVLANGRFVLLLGSQEAVSFRLGHNRVPTPVTEEHVTYTGDEVLYFDTVERKYGRAGKMLCECHHESGCCMGHFLCVCFAYTHRCNCCNGRRCLDCERCEQLHTCHCVRGGAYPRVVCEHGGCSPSCAGDH